MRDNAANSYIMAMYLYIKVNQLLFSGSAQPYWHRISRRRNTLGKFRYFFTNL
jgi:hypothetical protein